MSKACFPARGYYNRRLQCYRPTQFSGAEVGSEVWYLWIVIRTVSLWPLPMLRQICTVWCTKLRKHSNAIVEGFYCFTVAIGLSGDSSNYNEDKRSSVAARIQNKVVVECGNNYPLYTALVIGLTRERFVALGLPSWTHLLTRNWGVFTLQGLKGLLRVFGVWCCESWWIGENEKMKPDSLHKGAFCWCCWNRRDVILFSGVRKITASRQNRGELLSDEVMQTASHRNCVLQVTLIEFEQLLQGRKWELIFTLQSHFVDFSHDH